MGKWLSNDDLEELAVILDHRILHHIQDILTESMVTLMAALDDLNTAIANLTTATDAAVAAIGSQSSGLSAEQAATATAQVQAEADKLTAAVAP